MSERGFILVHRAVKDNWVWMDPEFFRAWIWLLMLANFDDNESILSGSIIEVKRGELITSLFTIVRETGLSMKRARNFLKNLEKGHMIVTEKGNKWTKITICNYDTYQVAGQTKGTQRARKGANRGQTEGNTIIKDNELNTTIINSVKDFVDNFNKIISRNFRPNTKVEDCFKKRVKEGYQPSDFILAVKNCAADPWHIENPHYLTPEFILRPEKLEKYLNWKPGQKQSIAAKSTFINHDSDFN
jgi:uncharacterized phage protein (TIGR02220 family)